MIEAVKQLRLKAPANPDSERRSELGQFMTPAPVARLMASMLQVERKNINILEPGAGVGSLIAAAVAELCARENRPVRISVAAYELDPELARRLAQTFGHCQTLCDAAGVEFEGHVHEGDFIELAVEMLEGAGDLFGGEAPPRFDVVITNPPYRKLNSGSKHRKLLRRVGIETSNLYAAFLALSVKFLSNGGEMVAITPRSFCNGPYFRPLREILLEETAFQKVHIFESRKAAFKEDAVLQENIIFRLVRAAEPGDVVISLGNGSRDAVASERTIHYDQLVWPGDQQHFIHIVPDNEGQAVADRMGSLVSSLDDLGIEVSTGRVVDFRAKKHLRKQPEPGAVPLIYPAHFNGGFVTWPIQSRKSNAVHVDDYTRDQLVPLGTYVLVKRFSSKEERRRIVAVVFDPSRILAKDGEGVGFENKLNYFHRNGSGLDLQLAKGLALFLNSTLADNFFRQFSGHTQVNATDLRTMTYPTEEQLIRLGAAAEDVFLDQAEIDAILERALLA